jgi:hypothetical protein
LTEEVRTRMLAQQEPERLQEFRKAEPVWQHIRGSRHHLRVFLFWAVLLLGLSAPRAHAQSLLGGDPANNPNGAFTYGTLNGPGITKFNTVSFPNYGGGPLTSWNHGSIDPNVMYNTNPTHVSHLGNILWPINSMHLHPAANGTPAVVRFTAPAAGQYRAVGYFDNRNKITTSDAHIRANGGSPLFNAAITGGGSFGKVAPFDLTVNLAAGGTLDFYVGYGSNGNYGSDSTGLELTIQGDLGPPTTTASLSGTQGLADWFTSGVEVTLTASDPDGVNDVAGTYFSLDGSGAGPYTGPFTVSGDGVHTVEFWSIDSAANEEDKHLVEFKIDATPPVTLTVLPEPNANGWYRDSVVVILAASDLTSGVAATYYQLDGGLPQEYLAPFLISAEGVHLLSYWSGDAAGNSEFPGLTNIAIDKTAPAAEVHATPNVLQARNAAGQRVFDTEVRVYGKCSDLVSGVEAASVEFEVTDDYGIFQPRGAVTIDEAGNFSFVIDFAGETAVRPGDNYRFYYIRIGVRDLAGNSGDGTTLIYCKTGVRGIGGGRRQ